MDRHSAPPLALEKIPNLGNKNFESMSVNELFHFIKDNSRTLSAFISQTKDTELGRRLRSDNVPIELQLVMTFDDEDEWIDYYKSTGYDSEYEINKLRAAFAAIKPELLRLTATPPREKPQRRSKRVRGVKSHHISLPNKRTKRRKSMITLNPVPEQAEITLDNGQTYTYLELKEFEETAKAMKKPPLTENPVHYKYTENDKNKIKELFEAIDDKSGGAKSKRGVSKSKRGVSKSKRGVSKSK
jgi:hypothetical protein